MNRIAVSAIALMSMIGIAHAAVDDTGHYGAWTTFEGTSNNNRPICGTSISSSDKFFSIKFQGNQLFVQFAKSSWNIPKGTNVRVSYQVDSAPPIYFDAYGIKMNDMGAMEFAFDWDQVNPRDGENYVRTFLNLMQNGRVVRFSFPNGSETDWVASLDGSSDAIDELMSCAGDLASSSKPTQPFMQAKGRST